MISEKIFWDAQEIRINRQPSVKVRKEFTLENSFAGLIYCAKCGKRIGRTTTTRYRVPRFRCVNQRNCHNGSSNYDLVERQIIAALRVWLKGYRVKVSTIGFGEDIAACKKKIAGLDDELEKRNAQMERAYDMVEQGVYSLELFKTRQEKIGDSVARLQQQKNILLTSLAKYEQTDAVSSNLIPTTENLLESYDTMSPKERNALLKEILYKIEYDKGPDGKIVIDLFPKLPKI